MTPPVPTPPRDDAPLDVTAQVGAETKDDADVAVDGRTARRDRNREAVLDAAIELFGEGDLAPSAASVAERSGVSLRSVYRYYDDLDELLRASIARSFVRNEHLFHIEGVGEGPLDERVERFVTARVRLHGQLAGMARAAVVRARTNELVRARLTVQMGALRAQTEAMFAPELDRLAPADAAEVRAALAVATGFEALEVLTQSLGLGSDETAAVMRRSVLALLAPG